VGYKKPHPIIFEHALDHTQTNAHNSLMIGDSLEADVLGAMNIGMQAIHFNSHNEPQHDHCPMVENLDEISIML
jgi:putative hydrolase of the HAD superfamily